MRYLLLAALLVPTPVVAQTPRTPEAILNDIDTTAAKQAGNVAELRAALQANHPTTSAELAAGLLRGGDIYLQEGLEYPGSYVVSKPTNLVGWGATLTGSTSGPAVRVLASHVYLSGFQAKTSHPDAVIVIGTGSETTSEQTPEDVQITHVTVDDYRGKRALAVHGRNVRAIQNTFTNIWTLTGQDSQAIWVGNAPCRPCLIDGNELSAGSEILMVGGANMAIPDLHPADIRITRNHLFRPESWRTDGVGRAVKNIIELKDGEDVLIADNDAEGSWVNGQDGPAIVLTSKSGGNVQRVVIEHNRITRAGYGFQMAAADYHIDALPTPALLSGVVVRQNYVEASRLMGTTVAGVFKPSRGILALVLGGIRDVTFEGNTALTDGGVFIEADSRGSYLSLDRVLVPNPSIGKLSITNNWLISGVYGLRINGYQGGMQPVPPGVDVAEFTGNTVADATAILKKTFPTNTYITRAEWDALVK